MYLQVTRKGHTLSRRNAALLFQVLAALFYSPLLLGVRTFPDGDFTHHFLPFSLFQRAELVAGRLPIWNPYTYGGHPFLADTQAAVFYPLNILGILVGYPFEGLFASVVASRLYFLQLEVVIHVGLAGFFLFLLLDHLTQNRMAGLVSGITFAFSGYLTGYPPLQLAILRTAIWLPLLLYLLVRATEAPGRLRWWAAIMLAAWVPIMAGHPQTMLYIAYVTVAWFLFLFWGSLTEEFGAEKTYRLSRGRRGTYVIGGGVVSAAAILGLSSIQLLPSIEFTQLSVRASSSYEFVSGGFPLRDTWQLILPGVFTWFSPLYVGVAALGLATCSLGLFGDAPMARASVTLMRRCVLFFGALALIGLLLSYGGNGLLYPFFYRLLPGWDLFRQQERAAYLVTFGLSALSGFGYAAVLHSPIPRRRLLILLYAAIVIAGVYAFGLLRQLPGDTVISNTQYLVVAAGTLITVALLSLSLWLPGWDRRRAVLIVGLISANLFAANVGTNLTRFGPERKTLPAPEMSALLQAVAENPTTNSGLPGRIYNEYRIFDDYGMRLRIEDVWGSSPLRLARYATLFDQFPLDRMWRLTGVGHVLTWRRELFEPSTLLGEFPQQADTTYLHRLAEPNPRAWLVSSVLNVSEWTVHDVASRLADHQFDLESVALAELGSGVTDIAIAEGAAEPNEVSLQRVSPTVLHVNIDSARGGFLLLSENFMSGLHVENLSCGKQVETCPQTQAGEVPHFTPFRANLSFVGMSLPAGTASFDVVYRPHTFRNGMLISLTTLSVLVLIGIIHMLRKGMRGRG